MSLACKSDYPKPSIVRVVYEFYPMVGGSVTHIVELSKKINPFLRDQTIIAPYFNDRCCEFDKKFEVKVVRVKYRRIKKFCKIPTIPFTLFSYSLSVYSQLKKMRGPYIIQAHGISNVAFCCVIGKLIDAPVIGMLHGSMSAYSKLAGLYETIVAKAFKPDKAFVLNDGSIAPTKFKNLWGEKVVIVNHGIDINKFKPMEKNDELIKELNLNKNDFVVLSTSSLNAVKNIDMLVQAFRLFLDEVKSDNVHLLIAGDGPLKDSLIKLSNELCLDKNVKFVGALPEDKITEYISISDVVAATSLYSNMNRSTMEAMACGKPVVVFDSGRTGELIKNMENGILVEPGDIKNFAKSLYLLHNNTPLSFKLGKSARTTVVQEKSWEKRIEQELKEYEKFSIL